MVFFFFEKKGNIETGEKKKRMQYRKSFEQPGGIICCKFGGYEGWLTYLKHTLLRGKLKFYN